MIREQLLDNLKEALKGGRSSEAGTVRLLISAIKNKEIEKRGTGETSDLTEEEVIDVLEKEAKKRRESFEVYTKAGREDLSAIEKEELEFIEKFLPKKMNEEEVAMVIDKIIASGLSEFNLVIKEAMKELKGKAHGTTITKVIKEKLGA